VTDEGSQSLYWNIPIANTTVLLLGTGTSITQAAMRELAKAGVELYGALYLDQLALQHTGTLDVGSDAVQSIQVVTLRADEVVPIEFISKFLVQPFSHTVRLFANMLAGHILLVTFGVLTAALIGTGVLATVVGVLPLVALIFFTLFEVLVAFLQAYVFTLLTGVYINAAISHDH